MHRFRGYVRRLESLLGKLVRMHQSDLGEQEALSAALNGEPGKELRRLVPLPELRKHGAFFTGSKLALDAVGGAVLGGSRSTVIADLACGAGDLLIACSTKLPIKPDLSQTIEEWGKSLIGRDVHPEFVKAAKARLVLAAMERGAAPQSRKMIDLDDIFPNIRIGCGRKDATWVRKCSHIVLNPPFTMVDAPAQCSWGAGLVNAAALFVEYCLSHAKVGAHFVGILPEVLRCGTRYQRWRLLVETLAKIKRIEPVGQFDHWTDVDVFIMEAEVRPKGERDRQAVDWGHGAVMHNKRVGDYFDVSVGSVVPFRASGRGRWTPYFHAHALPAWAVVDRAPKRIRYPGKPLDTPLVVVRRTSRLGDKKRAIGTIIVGGCPVAIENHLVVLRPKDGRLETCEKLLGILGMKETDAWLDRRMRCRHLTVSSLRDLPWLSEEK